METSNTTQSNAVESKPVLSLSEFLTVDSAEPHEHILTQCVGDPYLFSNNLIWSSLRQSFHKCGGQFSPEESVFAKRYFQYPYLEFLEVIKSKRVPLRENRSALLRLASEYEDINALNILMFVNNNNARNVFVHDCAHIVANGVLFDSVEEIFTKDFNDHWVLRMLLAEAFGSTAELMSSFYCNSIEEYFFLKFNLHLTLDYPEILWRRRDLQAPNDRALLFDWILYCFLSCLFDRDGMRCQSDIFERVMKPYEGTALYSKKKNLVFLYNHIYRINHNFRNEVNQLFFNMMGLKKSLSDILDFDFTKMYFKNNEIIEYKKQLYRKLFPKSSPSPTWLS